MTRLGVSQIGDEARMQGTKNCTFCLGVSRVCELFRGKTNLN